MRTVVVALLLSTSLIPLNFVSAVEQVVPGGLATVEGDSNNAWPFGADADYPTQRYQQVYDASEFLDWGVPLSITEIAFRPDAPDGSAFSYSIPSIQINFSTTPFDPDGLSQTFADNVGADDTIVFSGALSLSSSFTGPSTGPKDFDIRITLQQPFIYDPSLGNLLLDVRRFAPISHPRFVFFDASEEIGDSVSRVSTHFSQSVDSPTGGTAGSWGLVTMFTMQPVPEPTTFTLLGLGTLALVLVRRP